MTPSNMLIISSPNDLSGNASIITQQFLPAEATEYFYDDDMSNLTKNLSSTTESTTTIESMVSTTRTPTTTTTIAELTTTATSEPITVLTTTVNAATLSHKIFNFNMSNPDIRNFTTPGLSLPNIDLKSLPDVIQMIKLIPNVVRTLSSSTNNLPITPNISK